MFLIPRRWAQVEPGEFRRVLRESVRPDARDAAPIADWEAAVAHYAGSPHAVAVNSGRQGMLHCLRHCGVGPDTEVIIPAYTLAGLIPLITGLGAKAVPADIAPDTLNVSAAAVRARITRRTRAILVLHTFGCPAPIFDLAELGRETGIAVIEDGAHALGARLRGQALGTVGLAGFFSFEPTKPVNTYGGGMVVTGDAALAEAIRAAEAEKPFDYRTLRKKVRAVQKEQWMVAAGVARPLLHLLDWPPTRAVLSRLYRGAQSVPGGDFRYTPVQARLGLAKLAGLDARIDQRARLAHLYEDLLGDRIAFQRVPAQGRSSHYFLAARIPGGAAPMKRWLLRRGIDAAAGDEVADDCGRLLGAGDCPEAARAFHEVLALPFHENMSEANVRKVANQLARGLDWLGV